MQCVNVLNEVTNFVRQRERRRGATKRVCAIELNEGRGIYLKTYSAVDKVDQMLKEWEIFYISWKMLMMKGLVHPSIGHTIDVVSTGPYTCLTHNRMCAVGFNKMFWAKLSQN